MSGPKTDLAEAHQDKTSATQLKGMANIMALTMKIQTFFKKQDINIQMHIKPDLEVWNSTMGMCKTIKYQNNPKTSIESTAHHNQCPMVCFKLHVT
jgi:hypothetical protein